MSTPTPTQIQQKQREICVCFAYLAYIGAVSFHPHTKQPYQLTDDEILQELENLMSSQPTKLFYPHAVLPPIAGEWKVVWGPATYTVPGSMFQDNMMYVAQLKTPKSGGPPQYVIATRGTNGLVVLDWLMQDFDLKQLMPWITGGTNSGSISEGTNIGLQILTTLKPEGDQVLQPDVKLVGSPSRVMFSGSSVETLDNEN